MAAGGRFKFYCGECPRVFNGPSPYEYSRHLTSRGHQEIVVANYGPGGLNRVPYPMDSFLLTGIPLDSPRVNLNVLLKKVIQELWSTAPAFLYVGPENRFVVLSLSNISERDRTVFLQMPWFHMVNVQELAVAVLDRFNANDEAVIRGLQGNPLGINQNVGEENPDNDEVEDVLPDQMNVNLPGLPLAGNGNPDGMNNDLIRWNSEEQLPIVVDLPIESPGPALNLLDIDPEIVGGVNDVNEAETSKPDEVNHAGCWMLFSSLFEAISTFIVNHFPGRRA